MSNPYAELLTYMFLRKLHRHPPASSEQQESDVLKLLQIFSVDVGQKQVASSSYGSKRISQSAHPGSKDVDT